MLNNELYNEELVLKQVAQPQNWPNGSFVLSQRSWLYLSLTFQLESIKFYNICVLAKVVKNY